VSERDEEEKEEEMKIDAQIAVEVKRDHASVSQLRRAEQAEMRPIAAATALLAPHSGSFA
jgi:hypothetical protein